jgi:hypothetical protein
MVAPRVKMSVIERIPNIIAHGKRLKNRVADKIKIPMDIK